MRIRLNFEFSSTKVPTHIGFIILMLVGALIAWLTVSVGEKIIKNMPQSAMAVHGAQVEEAINNIK